MNNVVVLSSAALYVVIMHNLIVVATVLLLTYKVSQGVRDTRMWSRCCSYISLLQFALSNWTFSLRLSSIQCCESPSCELVGTCNDLFVALCLLRESNRTTLDRQSCPLLIAGHDIIDRQLTPADGVDSFVRNSGHWNTVCIILLFFCLAGPCRDAKYTFSISSKNIQKRSL